MHRKLMASAVALAAVLALGACGRNDNAADTSAGAMGSAPGQTGGAMSTDTMGGMGAPAGSTSTGGTMGDTMRMDTSRTGTTGTSRP